MRPSDGWTTRCTAHRTNGEPCRAPAVRGARVCNVHGGAAPQVRASAAERIAALVDPALIRLQTLLNDPSSAVALAAVRDVLDRAGYSARQRLDVDMRQVAEMNGVDPDELVATVESILAQSRR